MLREILKQSSYLLYCFVLTSVINVAIGVYLARLLGPDIFAIFIFTSVVKDLSTLLFAINLKLPLVKMNRNYIYRHVFYLRYVGLAISSGLLSLSIIVISIFHHTNQFDSGVFLSLVISQIVSLHSAINIGRLEVENRYKEFSFTNIRVVTLVSLLVITASVFVQNVYLLVLKDFMYALFLLVFTRRGGSGSTYRFQWRYFWTYFWLSYKMWKIRMIEMLIDKMDKVFIGMFRPDAFLASYQQSRYYSEIPQTILNPITPLLYEKLNNKAVTSSLVSRSAHIIMLVLFGIGLLYGGFLWAYGSELISFILGPKWIEASHIVIYFAPYITILPLSSFIKILSFKYNFTRQVFYFEIISSVSLVFSFYISLQIEPKYVPLALFFGRFIFILLSCMTIYEKMYKK